MTDDYGRYLILCKKNTQTIHELTEIFSIMVDLIPICHELSLSRPIIIQDVHKKSSEHETIRLAKPNEKEERMGKVI